MAEKFEGTDQRHLSRSVASEASYKMFKARTRPKMTPISVGTTTKEVVKANANRVAFKLINNSTSIVYIGFRNDISATFAIPLAPGGGSFGTNVNDDGEMCTSEMFAFSSVANREMTLIESVSY